MNRLLETLSKIFFLVAILLFLTSCGYKDIDKRSYVVTIGIDPAESKENKFKILLKIAIPASDFKAGDPEFIVSEHESKSITDAVRMIKTKVDKELDFSHAKAIILNEEILQEDVGELLDWFMRRRDIQKVAWVGIGKPSAEAILKLDRKVERLPSNALFMSFGLTGTESDYIVSEYLFDFRKRITENGLDPILPILEVKEDMYFQINKAAVFNNEKLIMTLESEETKLLNILLNRTQNSNLQVKENEDKDSFFIAVDEAETNFEIVSESTGENKVRVDITLEGILEEVMVDLDNINLNDYKEKGEKQFQEKVVQLLTKFQKKEVDPIGFGLRYRATHFNEDDWEEWVSMYPEVEFDVNVKITLQGTGLLRKEM
ncbi:Ger(x)C family spore germination protein [Bacillus luteolus]|uniref:Ger(X)C family spore germination protein n=1 Tax=Litchfieldia luteola TaxID=682179 RepID=A0ABR9QL32_9BACI|nr:Ger(x)C family spore germination protein [Cytobacillus luteolus]MBE4909121.1 Ger(x)C family spore germination protein [Cytobacillus luteolus]MBP1940428.1 spore germination protein KC [Cytobacillus luteolus]